VKLLGHRPGLPGNIIPEFCTNRFHIFPNGVTKGLIDRFFRQQVILYGENHPVKVV
jgi:hypothetical protein